MSLCECQLTIVAVTAKVPAKTKGTKTQAVVVKTEAGARTSRSYTRTIRRVILQPHTKMVPIVASAIVPNPPLAAGPAQKRENKGRGPAKARAKVTKKEAVVDPHGFATVARPTRSTTHKKGLTSIAPKFQPPTLSLLRSSSKTMEVDTVNTDTAAYVERSVWDASLCSMTHPFYGDELTPSGEVAFWNSDAIPPRPLEPLDPALDPVNFPSAENPQDQTWFWQPPEAQPVFTEQQSQAASDDDTMMLNLAGPSIVETRSVFYFRVPSSTAANELTEEELQKLFDPKTEIIYPPEHDRIVERIIASCRYQEPDLLYTSETGSSFDMVDRDWEMGRPEVEDLEMTLGTLVI
ncbi:hypothetical protein K474DRAFT_268465 [Panus rudis PR-1116 ss-1]|nr:hypothetical protein K474DRAFT_268465 [Panus rudis PR-1116 ss-1]